MNTFIKISIVSLIVAGIAIYIIKIPVNTVLLIGFALICPLMHFFMGHDTHHPINSKSHHKEL